jgi:ElaB/YqjD/DUF883 family membrane-anchored ribosome-binding protein
VSAETSELKRLVDELDSIEFETASDIQEFTSKARSACKALATSLDYAAEELKAALEELPPPAGEGRRAMRAKARSVSRHLKRSASGVRQGGMEAVKTWRSVMKHYDYILSPSKKRKTIDLNA